MRDYLVKKLRKSEEEVDEIITDMQMEKMENRNASARIAFPKGANPKFDPYVRT
jgi:predicted house-cleaning noncanonical NTP pyrophosphatase (MazG superfamily)